MLGASILAQFRHNFVPQLATWRVVIGNDVLVDRVRTHLMGPAKTQESSRVASEDD